MGSLRVNRVSLIFLSLYSAVYETADKNLNYEIIYLDFSKAFDSVPHQRLLTKVKGHGIDGRVYNWIKAWLNGIEQRVQINGKKSNCGVQ